MPAHSKRLPTLSQRDIDRFWSKVDKTTSCWEWTGACNKAGYGRFSLKPAGVFLAHRVALAITHREPKSDVTHHCGNHKCVNPD